MSLHSSRILSKRARGLSFTDLPLYDSKTIADCNGPQSCVRNANWATFVLSFADHAGDAVIATASDSLASTRRVFHTVRPSTGLIANFPGTLAQASAS